MGLIQILLPRHGQLNAFTTTISYMPLTAAIQGVIRSLCGPLNAGNGLNRNNLPNATQSR